MTWTFQESEKVPRSHLTLVLTPIVHVASPKFTNAVLALHSLQVPYREAFKYYFADFVRKGGYPPLYGQNSRQKRSYGFGGYPPPLYGFFPENFP